jgi:methyl halide transferase
MSQMDTQASNWENRYHESNTPWDLSTPTPECLRLINEKHFLAGREILVPGAGRGYDALAFAKAGLSVSSIDIAPTPNLALLSMAQAERCPVRVFTRDFFSLTQDPYHHQRYDYIWEYTFFCAIDPALRAEYVKMMRLLLRPQGILVALFFPLHTEVPNPPPYPVKEEEIHTLFRPYFDWQVMTPQQSIKPRAGRELLYFFKLK